MAKRGPRMTWGPKPENAIQFKVTLRYIRPPIWRRIVLPDSFTLAHLHDAIQVAMGWYDSHMHTFRIAGVYYTSKQMCEMDDMDMECDDRALLRDVAGQPKQKFMYEYDPGDSWEHDIVVEKILPFDPQAQYPVCLDGARACPPEDCGSFPGYSDILEALKAPKKTAEQKELLEWVGDDYDPERFDLEAVNRRLAGKR
ncbi:MAG: plasmid pRiA4b ORF-3 family protein [Kiritimatiellia bacterium]